MLSQDRRQLRSIYAEVWRKTRAGEPLEPFQAQVAEVIGRHPEYQPALEAEEDALDRDYLPEQGETNPFLHMGLHLSVLDQVRLDQPAGIRRVYRQLVQAHLGDHHEAEHAIMQCLAEALWRVQHDGKAFNDKAYLRCLRRQRGIGAGP